MKNGISLITSWLKDRKKCQIVQSNWSASSGTWELHNEDTIEEVMMSVQDFFNGRFKYNIFRNTRSPLSLVKQGEIDVLGLEIRSEAETNLFAINTAFNESGLDFGTNSLKIEKVLKNMICSAMLIHGFYNLTTGKIIYAAPRINQSIKAPLTDAVKALNEIFKVYGFQFSFLLYINEEFVTRIQNPVANLLKPVKDVLQVEVGIPTVKSPTITSTTEQYLRKIAVTNDQLKIGILVRTEMDKLIINRRISDEMIQQLLDEKYSKYTFDLNYPLLKKILKNQSLMEQRMENGYGRFWSKVYVINGGKYLICNDWYERHRTKFLTWVEFMNSRISS